jgi:uncharacterized protein YkwD
VPRKLFLIVASLVLLAVPASSQARAGRVIGVEVSAKQQAAVAARTAARTAAAGSKECENADLVPSAENLEEIRAAIVCLHNQVRAEHGLPGLRGNTRLRRAAEGHSADMVSAKFFDHTTPRGVTMVDRILRARYVRANQGWLLGENLEWGTGRLATPQGAIDAWMDSPGHRANLLKRGYRDMGVGISLGVPTGNSAGATYTVDFGVRR